jgi:hypothetical protein
LAITTSFLFSPELSVVEEEEEEEEEVLTLSFEVEEEELRFEDEL